MPESLTVQALACAVAEPAPAGSDPHHGHTFTAGPGILSGISVALAEKVLTDAVHRIAGGADLQKLEADEIAAAKRAFVQFLSEQVTIASADLGPAGTLLATQAKNLRDVVADALGVPVPAK